jgi:hypothetical protein
MANILLIQTICLIRVQTILLLSSSHETTAAASVTIIRYNN